jgi:2-succinyl-5-enolpyruvyl-6-hydroxy-3-cyclohexene-1-carboxylate synthase
MISWMNTKSHNFLLRMSRCSSSALGFAEASQSPTTLVIGDVSALHDIGSMHSLANDATVLKQTPGKKSHPLTTIVVNNNGGFTGIWSSLPALQTNPR